MSTLQRFSQILNSSAAASYELMVVGHTDNQPVRNPKTIAEGNFDNWYLSAHRAIAVAAALVGDGVSKGRIGVAGYADQQPIPDNTSSGGRASNRRVEIVILPTTARSHGYASSGGGAHMASQRIAPRHLDKDSVANTSSGSGLSK